MPAGLLPATASEVRQRWEEAVVATEALLHPTAPWIGSAGTASLAEWWSDTLLLALVNFHLTQVPPSHVLDWFDRLTVTLGWSQGQVPWSDARLSLGAVQAHAEQWGQDLGPTDQVRLATLVAVWMVPSVRGPLEDLDGTPIEDQIAQIHRGLQQGGRLPSSHPLRQAIQASKDPELGRLAEQWMASERLGGLHQRPASPATARRRRT